jgi:hypothetical protein
MFPCVRPSTSNVLQPAFCHVSGNCRYVLWQPISLLTDTLVPEESCRPLTRYVRLQFIGQSVERLLLNDESRKINLCCQRNNSVVRLAQCDRITDTSAAATDFRPTTYQFRASDVFHQVTIWRSPTRPFHVIKQERAVRLVLSVHQRCLPTAIH